jgi:hypothetical protein
MAANIGCDIWICRQVSRDRSWLLAEIEGARTRLTSMPSAQVESSDADAQARTDPGERHRDRAAAVAQPNRAVIGPILRAPPGTARAAKTEQRVAVERGR